MGIDDIKRALADLEHRGGDSGQQLGTVSQDLERMAGQLAGLAQGSNDVEVQSAHGLISRAADDAAQIAQALEAATESLRSYAGRL